MNAFIHRHSRQQSDRDGKDIVGEEVNEMAMACEEISIEIESCSQNKVINTRQKLNLNISSLERTKTAKEIQFSKSVNNLINSTCSCSAALLPMIMLIAYLYSVLFE